MKSKELLLGLVVALLMCPACVAEGAEPIPVEQLAKSPPHEFRQILVLGQVDSCSGFSCNLCPAEMTRDDIKWDQCVSFSFEGFRDFTQRTDVSRLMEEAFRFATVVLEADWDPTCLPNPDPNAKEEIIVCTDRASLITHARTLKVLSRKNARDGIINTDWGALVEPDESDKAAMTKIIMVGYPTEKTAKFFQVRDYPYLDTNLTAIGLGCFCMKASCADDWPQRYFLGFNSPANPFRCIRMEKHPDGWHIPIYN